MGTLRPHRCDAVFVSRFDWLWNHDLQQDLNLAYSRLGWKAALAA
ncbi:protein of unknown function [Ectopseudomonas oleovorans]|nr:protein of unknown function [Pseudomonas oleovorans]